MGILWCCFALVLCLGVMPGECEISNNKQGVGRQVANIHFVFPVWELLRGNYNWTNNYRLLGGPKEVITKTTITTVSTVTVQAFRTCTSMPVLFPSCAGRKRRDTHLEDLNATPSMRLIIDQTQITDPFQIAHYLDLRNPKDLFEDPDLPPSSSDPELVSAAASLQLGDEPLLPSYDSTIEASEEEDQDEAISHVAVETPYIDGANSKSEASNEASTQMPKKKKGRLIRFRADFEKTPTSTISVTQVVSSTVTAPMQTLTVVYNGCSPAGRLPIIGTMCPNAFVKANNNEEVDVVQNTRTEASSHLEASGNGPSELFNENQVKDEDVPSTTTRSSQVFGDEETNTTPKDVQLEQDQTEEISPSSGQQWVKAEIQEQDLVVDAPAATTTEGNTVVESAAELQNDSNLEFEIVTEDGSTAGDTTDASKF